MDLVFSVFEAGAKWQPCKECFFFFFSLSFFFYSECLLQKEEAQELCAQESVACCRGLSPEWLKGWLLVTGNARLAMRPER